MWVTADRAVEFANQRVGRGRKQSQARDGFIYSAPPVDTKYLSLAPIQNLDII